MKTKQELKEYLLENCVDENGDLDLSYLDFSDFDGSIDISNIKVKCDLWQNWQTVNGNLYQNRQRVDGDLYQDDQEVGGDLYQDEVVRK